MKQNMFRGNTQSNIVKMVVILALFFLISGLLKLQGIWTWRCQNLGQWRCRFHIIEHYHLFLLIHTLTYQVGFMWICCAAVDAAPRASTNDFFFFFDVAQFGPKLFEIGLDMGPKWSKIKPDKGRNTYRFKKKKKEEVNFKFIFYLDLVSNFWYCILIYEHHVMVMYLLYYLLLLLNWYMFTIIWKKILSNILKIKIKIYFIIN